MNDDFSDRFINPGLWAPARGWTDETGCEAGGEFWVGVRDNVGSDEKSDGWRDAWGGASASLVGKTCVIVDLFLSQRPNRGVYVLSTTATPRSVKYYLISQFRKTRECR